MTPTDNKIINPARLTAGNSETQHASQSTEQSTAPAPGVVAYEKLNNYNSPLPHERRLSESGQLAVDKKIEARKAMVESRYYAKKERIEMTYAGNMEHPKALKKQAKLDDKRTKNLGKLDKKHDRRMALKKAKIEHPPK